MANQYYSIEQWDSVISVAESQARIDSKFVYRAYFAAADSNQIQMHFAEETGQRYHFKLLSRRLDSIQRIDFVPAGIQEKGILSGSRISDIKLRKTGQYFEYSFYYKREQGYKSTNIVFDGINYLGIEPKDFVIFVYKE